MQKTEDQIIMNQGLPQLIPFTSSAGQNSVNRQAQTTKNSFKQRTITIPTTTTTPATQIPMTASTSTPARSLLDQQLNQFELKAVKPISEVPTKIPFIADETVEDLGIIKYPVPEILKKTKVFGQLQNRKLFLEHACKYAKGS